MNKNLTNLLEKPLYAKILSIFAEGRAYTFTEVTQFLNAEDHMVASCLEKLRRYKVLKLFKSRHHYYKMVDLSLWHQIENLNNPDLAASQLKPAEHKHGPCCHTCYNHLAGKVAVQITDALVQNDIVRLDDEAFTLTSHGQSFFEKIGIDIMNLKTQRRPLLKACLDFSERKFHLAGSLGDALRVYGFENGWLQRGGEGRTILLTQTGKSNLEREFGLEFCATI